ncbi:hypothetical protein M514_12311 [Trichuris suis]|uniref:Uncharacterized protein n=1 Tax=Trichuris suis TaxID=68888 RepID=A0A085MX93_9BILA|nr:hypothetical protein M513_12311 [Trichuris suis]KFD61839.1 hypothetical protein M514_12311 [Trichuris suis]
MIKTTVETVPGNHLCNCHSWENSNKQAIGMRFCHDHFGKRAFAAECMSLTIKRIEQLAAEPEESPKRQEIGIFSLSSPIVIL